MRKLMKAAAIGVAGIAAMLANPAHAAIVNISSLDATGTTVSLAAGTYSFHLIGSAQGGAYDGWNAWGGSSGCDGSGGNCENGYIEQFGFDLGNNGVFDETNGRYFAMTAVPGQTFRYDTAVHALSVYATMIQSSPLDVEDYSAPGLPYSFTLASAQDVHFWIGDSNYYLNLGGVSLELSAVPEPASWAMMVAGFGLTGAALRRRSPMRAAAA